MGYAHYMRRPAELPREEFAAAARDAQEIITYVQETLGIKLAGPTGAGEPEITRETIAFNGARDCGHRYRNLGKPFASATAEGVESVEPPYNAHLEPYHSGPYLDTRVCGGCCAGAMPYGPFVFERRLIVADWERAAENGYERACETDFKPYDLPVTAVMIRIKERLKDRVVVTSENPENGFEDAKRMCKELFGWAENFSAKAVGASD